MLSSRTLFPALLKTVVAMALSAVALCAAIPRGWYVTGSKPHDYQTGIDEAQHNGHGIAFLTSVVPSPNGFGTLMQDFRANRYVDTRVRLRASLKADEVSDWAGLWMRIDKSSGETSQILAFDNMSDRRLKGTTAWQDCQVVLDVPAEATNIYFGVTLGGSGKISISDVSFESVDQDVPTTAEKPESPRQSYVKWSDFHRPLEVPFNLEFQP